MEQENEYDRVTNRILEELERGAVPWHKPWVVSGGAVSRSSGKSYSLVNQLTLFRPGEYLTLDAATKLGGVLKADARVESVVFWRMARVNARDAQGEEAPCFIPVLKRHVVYHVDDFVGIKPKYPAPEFDFPNVARPDEKVEELALAYAERARIKLTRKQISTRAFFHLVRDEVVVPKIEQFNSTEEYYSTFFHELVHSTGAPGRLNRQLGKRKESRTYATEELVAEIGACFLMRFCGLDLEKTIGSSAAYIDSWREKIKANSKQFATAAARAQKAVEYILGGKDWSLYNRRQPPTRG